MDGTAMPFPGKEEALEMVRSLIDEMYRETGTFATDEYIEMMKITQAKRPFNSQMSKAKLEACGISVPEWKDGLRRYLEEAKTVEA